MEDSALQGFAFLSIVLFSVVGTVMGVRLLLLARRTRALPEFALGLALVMIATLGYPLSIASLVLAKSDLAVRIAIFVACAGTVDIGLVATGVFTWRVFRRDSMPAMLAVLAAGASLLVLLLLDVRVMLHVDSPEAYIAETRIHTTIYFGVSSLIFGWTAIESVRWWRQLCRRVALSLADPVVANRFLLWALWGFGTMAASVMHGVYTWLGETLHHPVPLTFSAACGLFNAACLFLAFFAPESYAAWVQRRAERA